MKFRIFKRHEKLDYRAEIVTSAAGAGVLVFVIIEAIFKAAAGPRPALDNSAALVAYMSTSANWILEVVLADTFLLVSMTVFIAGLLALAYKKRGSASMAMVAAALFAIIYVTITLFGDSFDAGTALNATQSMGDANVIRTLIESHIVIFGPVGGIVLAFLASSIGIVILQSKVLPRWTAILGFVVALLNFIAIPALFNSYGAHSADVALLALVSCVVWVFAVSVALIINVLKKREIS